MKLYLSSFLVFLVLWMPSCMSTDNANNPAANNPDAIIEEEEIVETNDGVARITEVVASGQDTGYSFNVTISSPDLGCNQYADWWEVIDLDGNLLYRRTLSHSHVDEQPFTRLGGPVDISENTEVYIRAHMNTTSYGSGVFKGSVADGFNPELLNTEFAKNLEEIDPLPANCAF